MATVDKNFKVKHGLIVEGTTATVNGNNVITTGSSTDDLQEGSTNQYYTTARAKGDAADLLTNANLTNITITGDENGLTITAENGGIQDISGFDTDDLTEGSTNLYFTDSRALTATASAYDTAGAAAAVATDLNTHINDTSAHGVAGDVVGTSDAQTLSNKEFNGETKFHAANGAGTFSVNLDNSTGAATLKGNNGNLTINAYGGALVLSSMSDSYVGSQASGNEIATKGYVDGLASNYDPAGSAATAEDNANSYTDTALGSYTTTANLDTTIDGYGYLKSADLSGYATESYVGTAIDNLVDGAPGLLDTLNEIAAAIADDANYATTMTTALAGKQDSLTAGSNISIDASDVISVTGLQASDISDFATAAQTANIGYYDPAGSASTAQSAAEDYADTVAATAESNAKGYADATFVTPSSLSSTLGGYIASTEKGDIGGVATLDNTGNVPLSQLGNVPDAYITSVGTNLSVDAGSLTIAGNPTFEEVNFAAIARQVATLNTGMTSGVSGIVARINLDTHTAGKFTVKVDTGTHTEISEILLTTDSSNNVAITEYGIVGTNGSLSTISASVSGGQVLLQVTPVDTADVTVVGTLLA
jgi:hypothetical protein